MNNEQVSKIETTSEKKQVYNALTDLIGPHSDLAQAFIRGLQQDLSVVPIHPMSLQQYHSAQDEIYDRREQSTITDPEMLDSLQALLDVRTQTVTYESAKRSLEDFEADGKFEAAIDDDTVGVINSLLRLAKHADEPTSSAPFHDFDQNTEDIWKYVTPNEVQQHLNGKPFLDTDTMYSLTRARKSSATLRRIESYGRPTRLFEIPTDMIVNAAGFGSWLGRTGRDGTPGNGEKSIAIPGFSYRDTSINAIKAYAGKPSELPPVGMIYLYVQANGVAFADNGGGDSHRIAAAMLRGNESIKAKTLSITLLSENSLE